MPQNEVKIEKIFLMLRTRARLIIGFFAAAVLFAALITYQIPKMYGATASLNFDFRGANPVDERGGSILTQDSYINTQIGILQSLTVAQKVVDSLTDYETKRLVVALEAKKSRIRNVLNRIESSISSFFDDADGKRSPEDNGDAVSTETIRVNSPYSRLAWAIGSDLVVSTEFQSRVVQLSYFSTDPQVAALIANKVAEAYIATNLKMVIDPAYKSKVWFDEQLKSLRGRLEEAQAKLTAYQQKEGIVSSDERIDIENARLQSLANQLVTAQETTRNADTTKQKLKEVLDSGKSLVTFEPVFNNAVVQKIRADIRSLEGQLVQSSSALGPNHPKIVKLKSELASANSKLDTEIKTITDGINNGADLSKQRERDLENALRSQKQLVLQLKNEHDRIAVLQREVESAQTTYNAALNQLNTTSMQSMVDQTVVSIIDQATIPSGYATPNIKMNLALGAFAGLLLGIAVALFLEISVRRIHSRDDLISELGIPLLGHLKRV